MSIDVVIRSDFSKGQLLERDLAGDPFSQLQRWLDDVTAAAVSEYQAMSLATASGAYRGSS